MHFVMQHLDLANEDLELQIKDMVIRDLLTQQQADSVNVDGIRTFLSSPLGTRMREAEIINREVRFNLNISCQEVYPDMKEDLCQDEKLLLQGVIDCYFEEPDGIVLIDYKTDYVPEGGEDAIKERYHSQIHYYAGALEKLTGKVVKEKYIYLFHNGKVLEY